MVKWSHDTEKQRMQEQQSDLRKYVIIITYSTAIVMVHWYTCFHCIRKMDIRSRPHFTYGTPHYSMALQRGLFVVIRST